MENKCHHLLVELLCKKHWNLSGARKIFCWSTQLPAFHSHQEERRMLSSRVGIHTMHTSWPHKCEIRRWMTHEAIFSSRPLNHTLGTNSTRKNLLISFIPVAFSRLSDPSFCRSPSTKRLVSSWLRSFICFRMSCALGALHGNKRILGLVVAGVEVLRHRIVWWQESTNGIWYVSTKHHQPT